MIVFQDEVHFYQSTAVTRKWVLRGSKPQVSSAPSRKSLKYSGYIIANTGQLIVTQPEWFTYKTVIASLREFIARMAVGQPGQHCVVVLDNAPWHKKAFRLIVTEMLPEYKDIRDAITLELLLAYSPDLNPIEQC